MEKGLAHVRRRVRPSEQKGRKKSGCATSQAGSCLGDRPPPGRDCVSVNRPYFVREGFTRRDYFESGNVFAKAEKTIAEGFEICICSCLLSDNFGQIAFLFGGES